MTISAALQDRYSTEVDIDWWEAIVLSHPKIETLYLANLPVEQVGLVDGVAQVFRPLPFKTIQPKRDGTGRQEMQLVIENIGLGAVGVLDQALEDPSTPISCRYTIYLFGSPEPQVDPPIVLNLSDISVTQEAVACSASRSDILNLPFPREVYRPDLFPGLDRR
jgi:hypothetical protein